MAQKRFERIYHQGAFALASTEIFIDRETGVHYLFHTNGEAGGITPLLDRDGKVVISSADKSIY